MSKTGVCGPVTMTFEDDGSVTTEAPAPVVLFCQAIMRNFDALIEGEDLSTPQGQAIREGALQELGLVISLVAGPYDKDG